MPILELFAAAVIGAVGKTFVDSLWTTECWQKWNVRRHLTVVEPIDLKSGDIVSFEAITDIIIRRVANVDYGVFVLAAPPGSGKSTFIKMTLPKLREKFRYIKILRDDENLFGMNIQESLHIPRRCALSEYLPAGTLIIIDQIDLQIESLPLDVKAYITALAADSVNSKKFKMMFCVSDPNTAREILSCNGGEKVQEISCRDSLVWSKAQLDTFIAIKLPRLSSQEIQRLESLAKVCRNSPGLIEKASVCVHQKSISEGDWKTLQRYADTRAASWGLFATIFQDEKVAHADDVPDNKAGNTVVTTLEDDE
eukprot:gene9313-10280_t